VDEKWVVILAELGEVAAAWPVVKVHVRHRTITGHRWHTAVARVV
jgi:hypothetical protein